MLQRFLFPYWVGSSLASMSEMIISEITDSCILLQNFTVSCISPNHVPDPERREGIRARSHNSQAAARPPNARAFEDKVDLIICPRYFCSVFSFRLNLLN